MNKTDGMKNSPYGDISKWIDKKDLDRYIYVYKIVFEEEGFKPPSAWFVNTAFGDRLYVKARDRKKAVELVFNFFGSDKYSIIADKNQQIR